MAIMLGANVHPVARHNRISNRDNRFKPSIRRAVRLMAARVCMLSCRLKALAVAVKEWPA